MKIIVVIPARYGSTRLPGKVLAKDTGKYLIQHTYEKACLAKLPQEVIIAADDKRVADACESFGAGCVLTSADHQSGTDRIAEAVADTDFDIVINLQADEPEIDVNNIDILAGLLIDNPDCQMATLVSDFRDEEQVADPNVVKTVVDSRGRAIYFSRSVVPYDRDAGGVGDTNHYLRHLGIYAYRKQFLLKFIQWPQSKLEKIEKLEQLRAIENGGAIMTAKVKHLHDGIDTAEQYTAFVKRTI